MAYSKTNWQNLPNQTTPINATNLNKIEQGIYDATYVNGVNVDNEVDEDYRVNIIKGKNLFDGSLQLGYNPTDLGNNVTNRLTCDYIEVKPNTNYVCSLNATTSGKTPQYYIYEFSNKGVTPTGTQWRNSGTSFTTSSATKYVTFCLKYTDDSNINVNSFNNIQFEKGSSATTYEPYVETSIYVDGEEIYNQNIMTYSTDEIRIGTWLGKPLYRKIVSNTFGNVTEGTQSELSITLNNVDFALIDKYWIDRMDESNPAINQGYAPDVIYLGYTSFSGSNCYLRFRTKVAFASSKKVYAIVLYTKTTDTVTRSLNTIEQTRSIPTESTQDDER